MRSRNPFAGAFQSEHYVYRDPVRRIPDRPVTTMRVKSLITAPHPGSIVAQGQPIEVLGRAWSGDGEIVRVEVSVDG